MKFVNDTFCKEVLQRLVRINSCQPAGIEKEVVDAILSYFPKDIEKEIIDPKPPKKEEIVDYTEELAKKMTEKLGRKVAISGKGKVRKLEISFSDDKELDERVNKLCGANIFDD